MSVVPSIAETYCFKWSDYHSHLSEIVTELLEQECMLDVTLCAEGQKIQAHRLVLSACSTLFHVRDFLFFSSPIFRLYK